MSDDAIDDLVSRISLIGGDDLFTIHFDKLKDTDDFLYAAQLMSASADLMVEFAHKWET